MNLIDWLKYLKNGEGWMYIEYTQHKYKQADFKHATAWIFFGFKLFHKCWWEFFQLLLKTKSLNSAL